jgi:hypothetical protein
MGAVQGLEPRGKRGQRATSADQALAVAPTLHTPLPVPSSGAGQPQLGPSVAQRDAAAFALDPADLEQVEREERAGDAARLRNLIVFVAPAWLLAGLFDLWAARTIDTSVLHFWVPRAATLVVVLAVFFALLRDAVPSRARLAIVSWTFLILPSIAMAYMALRYRGLTSPYAQGHLLVIAIYGTVLARSARRDWPLAVTLAVIYALVVRVGAELVPAVQAQLADTAASSWFAQLAVAHLGATGLATLSSHFQWKIRRQLYASKRRSRYVLEEKLGEGGMAEVWRATRADLDRPVALKILRAGADEQLTERFVREVKTTADLTHPHTVRVLDCGVTDDGALYYTMELLEGESLSQLVDREGPQPPARVAYFGLAASRALAEAHARGLVHRDIKPDNLFITATGGEPDFVKVLDFGIAKHVLQDANLTQDGARVGTPVYMSPEQAQGKPIDARADVYSIGACMYAALLAKPPLDNQVAMAVMLGGQPAPIIPPSVLREHIPPQLEVIVMRCMAPDPRQRYADGGQVAQALHETGLPQMWAPHRGQSAVRRPRTTAQRALTDTPTRDIGTRERKEPR